MGNLRDYNFPGSVLHIAYFDIAIESPPRACCFRRHLVALVILALFFYFVFPSVVVRLGKPGNRPAVPYYRSGVLKLLGHGFTAANWVFFLSLFVQADEVPTGVCYTIPSK